MNWIQAFRYCGGLLNENEIQQVRDYLDELGYETELDHRWIGLLRRGSEIQWNVSTSGGDRANALGVITALRAEDIGLLNARFGSFSVHHLPDDRAEIEEMIDEFQATQLKPKPFVGQATKLPLP